MKTDRFLICCPRLALPDAITQLRQFVSEMKVARKAQLHYNHIYVVNILQQALDCSSPKGWFSVVTVSELEAHSTVIL